MSLAEAHYSARHLLRHGAVQAAPSNNCPTMSHLLGTCLHGAIYTHADSVVLRAIHR